MKHGAVIHHNGPPAKCVGQPHSRCDRFWNGVRRYHGEKFGSKWAATSLYSFGVCPHGVIYVGCGWHKNQAANGTDVVGADDGRDKDWYTIFAFVGGGEYGGYSTGHPEERVTPEMERAIVDLVHAGQSGNYMSRAVLSHNRFKKKACPGPTLTALAIDLNAGRKTIKPVEDDTVKFTVDEAAAYVREAYERIAKRRATDEEVYLWAHAISGDPREMFKLQMRLFGENR